MSSAKLAAIFVQGADELVAYFEKIKIMEIGWIVVKNATGYVRI